MIGVKETRGSVRVSESLDGLRRKWLETGGLVDGAALVAERARRGDVDVGVLEAVAYGSPLAAAALRLLGVTPTWDEREEYVDCDWYELLFALSPVRSMRLAVLMAETFLGRTGHAAEAAKRVLRTAHAWVEGPSAHFAEELREAIAELPQPDPRDVRAVGAYQLLCDLDWYASGSSVLCASGDWALPPDAAGGLSDDETTRLSAVIREETERWLTQE